MGTLTYTDMKDEIKKHHADRDDLTDSRLNRLIAVAENRIARLYDWDELQYTYNGVLTVSPGDTMLDRRRDRIFYANPFYQSISEATDARTYRVSLVRSIKVRESNTGRSIPLQSYVRRKFDELHSDPDYDDRDMPVDFTWGRNRVENTDPTRFAVIELWPAPDLPYEYETRVQVYPRSIYNGDFEDDDGSDFQNLDDAIVQLVVADIYGSLGREDKSDKHYGIAASMLKEQMRMNDSTNAADIVGIKGELRYGGNYWQDPFIKQIS